MKPVVREERGKKRGGKGWRHSPWLPHYLAAPPRPSKIPDPIITWPSVAVIFQINAAAMTALPTLSTWPKTREGNIGVGAALKHTPWLGKWWYGLRTLCYTCAWPRWSFPSPLNLSLWWGRVHYTGTQGRCDNWAPTLCVHQISPGKHNHSTDNSEQEGWRAGWTERWMAKFRTKARRFETGCANSYTTKAMMWVNQNWSLLTLVIFLIVWEQYEASCEIP